MNWNIRNDAPVYTQLVDQIARAIILGQRKCGNRWFNNKGYIQSI